MVNFKSSDLIKMYIVVAKQDSVPSSGQVFIVTEGMNYILKNCRLSGWFTGLKTDLLSVSGTNVFGDVDALHWHGAYRIDMSPYHPWCRIYEVPINSEENIYKLICDNFIKMLFVHELSV